LFLHLPDSKRVQKAPVCAQSYPTRSRTRYLRLLLTLALFQGLGLIWTNPRFSWLDSCGTWDEALASRQFRFKNLCSLGTLRHNYCLLLILVLPHFLPPPPFSNYHHTSRSTRQRHQHFGARARNTGGAPLHVHAPLVLHPQTISGYECWLLLQQRRNGKCSGKHCT
jgi:hypothetical protein